MIMVLVFILACLFALMAFFWLFDLQHHKAVINRLEQVTVKIEPVRENNFLSNRPLVQKRIIPYLKSLEYILISSGIRMDPVAFLAVPAVLGGLGGAVLWFLSRQVFLSLAVLLAGGAAPFCFAVFKKKQLEKAVIEEMPEAIGIVVRALQVGHSVDAALKDAARSLAGPLSIEIKIIYQEVTMGLSFEQALRNFENRYPTLSDVTLFCTAFIIQRETGGNLVNILDALADTIRKRFVFQQKIRTFSAEARLSAMVISLLPILFVGFAFIFNPDYITCLTATVTGRILIYIAVALECVGFFVMRRMTRLGGK